MIDVKYVLGEDWEGIYIQDKLIEEGHRIRFRDGFEAFCEYFNNVEGANAIEFSTYDIDQDWLEDEGSLPEYFESIPADTLRAW